MSLIVGENSYGSRAEADAYFADSLKSAEWVGLTTTKRDQGLVEATRVLEREHWLGTKEDPGQTLDFPRTGLTCNGESVTAAESLAIIKTAQFEYAIDIIGKPAMLNVSDPTGLNNIKSAGAGSAKVEFFAPSQSSKYPATVKDIINCFLASSSASVVGSYVSGACDDSSFDDPDLYGLTQGYP